MKKLLLLFILFTGVLTAQNNNKYEKIKALKTAYITEQLDFTASEAEKFWPIYNKHENVMQDIRNTQRKEIYSKLKNDFDALSEEELNAIILKDLALRTQELEIRKQLVSELGKIISAKKIVKLTKAEEDFKRKLLEHYRDQKRSKN